MPFKIKQSATYWWPVKFTTPSGEKPGQRDEHTFEVCFRRLDVKQHSEIAVALGRGELKDEVFLDRTVCGFRGVVDDEGVELPYTPEHLATLTSVPGVVAAIADAYFASSFKAGEKNS